MGLTRRKMLIASGVAVVAAAALLAVPQTRRLLHPILSRIRGRRTVEQRLAELGPAARTRLQPHLDSAGLTSPPRAFTFVVLKDERRLDLFAGTSHDTLHYIKSYPIHAASGDLGPKRREGDRQVPEGLYRIDSLNPNSRFHLSMRVDYPNADDRRIAQLQNRTDLGGDIFIHGGAASIGCVAVGDPAIEELFTLAADIGIENSEVILAPLDLRTRPLPDNLNKAPWPQRYNDIQSRLTQLPTPAPADP